MMPLLPPPDRIASANGSRLLGPDGKPIDRDDGYLLPSYRTFAAIYNALSGTYSFRYDEALKRLPADALAMRRDVYIRSLLQERALPTARRKWSVARDDPKDKTQQQLAQKVERAIKQIRRFTNFRRCLVEGAFWYGRYGVQRGPLVNVADGQGGSVPTFRDWQPVNGDKIQFTFGGIPQIAIGLAGAAVDNESAYDRYGRDNIVTADRFTMLKLANPKWRERFLIHRHDVDDADYFEPEMAGGVQGVGIRSVIYWAWWMRDECLSWALNYMQKVGTLGLLIFWYDANNPQAKAAAEKAASMASNESAFAAPAPVGRDANKTTGVELIAPSTAGIDALVNIITNYFEKHIERYIIGQTLSAGTEGSGLGGSGVADLHADTKFQLLAYDAENLDDTLSAELVQPLQRLIDPISNCPPMRFESAVPDPMAKDKLEGAKTIVEMGGQVKRDEVFEQVGLTVPGPEDDVLGGQPGTVGPEGSGGNGLLRPDIARQVKSEDGDDGEEDDRGSPPSGLGLAPHPKPSAPAPNGHGGGLGLAKPYAADAQGHEHRPAGSSEGGQFAPKGIGLADGGKTAPKSPEREKSPPAKPQTRQPAAQPDADKSKFVGEKVGKPEHVHADRVEAEVAAAVQGTVAARVKGKQIAYDVVVGDKAVLEVKSMLKGSKTAISVHDDAMLRKVNFVQAHPDKSFHTIVVDERATYGNGAYADKYSGNRLYYRRGSGRFALTQMHPVKDAAELKRLIAMPDDQLPEAARGHLPPPPPVAELKAKAERAHTARLAKDRARKVKMKAEKGVRS
jgi:hypothetical protein